MYTKGPWEVDDKPKYIGSMRINNDWNLIADNCIIAHFISKSMDNGYPDAESRANARLIAAAPELLEALKDITDYVMNLGASTESLTVARKALNAIRKATGE